MIFDAEPHGQHKYNHRKARSTLCFPDAAPADWTPPADAGGAKKKEKSKFKKKDRVEHSSRGPGTVKFVAGGEVTLLIHGFRRD